MINGETKVEVDTTRPQYSCDNHGKVLLVTCARDYLLLKWLRCSDKTPYMHHT